MTARKSDAEAVRLPRGHLDSRWLEDFLSLVETRSFSRSAETRGATQPAFSRRIRSLEEWAGGALFDRAAQPVALTPAGEAFRPVAQQALRQLMLGRSAVRRQTLSQSQTIVFSATHSLSLEFFPRWLTSLERGARTFRTRLETAQFNESVRRLATGDCHFLLCYSNAAMPVGLSKTAFVAKVLLEDRLLPVTMPDAAGRPLDLLPGAPGEPVHVLGYSQDSALSRAIDQILADAHSPVVMETTFVSQMTSILKVMAIEGHGMAWLPESFVRADLDAGRLVLAGDARWFAPLQARLFRQRDPLPAAAEEFWALLPAPDDAGWA